jgi:phosphoribosylglycinamide formyltransferase-1
MNVAVMCTGSGTNLQALLDAEEQGSLNAHIVLVISNRRKAFALERARSAGRETIVLRPRDFETETLYAESLSDELAARQIDLICLAGYLKRLPARVVSEFRGRILNIHPGPLPRFGGQGMFGHHVHESVLASGVSESGPTVFFVDEEYDTGAIIAHATVPVQTGDTPDALASRVLAAEHILYPRVVAAVASGRVTLRDGRCEGRLNE